MNARNSSEGRKARAMLTLSRVLVYLILIFLSILCLFSFYMLIINSTRTNADLQGGFQLLPQGHFLENLVLYQHSPGPCQQLPGGRADGGAVHLLLGPDGLRPSRLQL